MPKIQQSQQCFYLNLPKGYMKLLDWKKGDEVIILPAREEKKALLIKKIAEAIEPVSNPPIDSNDSNKQFEQQKNDSNNNQKSSGNKVPEPQIN